MPKQISAAWGRFSDTVRGFSVAQRTIAVIGIAALVLGGVVLATMWGKTSYAPLFTGLSAGDASAVVDQLDADGVSYQLSDGGATILVPQDSVYDERLKAASAGLPSSGGQGYALLDTMGVTASQFQQDTTYKRAMEGELAKTIDAMNGVKTSSVKLAIPKTTVFTAQKADPTASVFVQTRAGTELSSDQVNAIVHLVSASIEDMKAKDVSVVDSNGDVLSAAGKGLAGSADKLAGDYEQATKAHIQELLDPIVGAGNSTIAVSATVDSSTSTTTSENYSTPEGAPARSESSTTEKYTGTGQPGAGGILGPDEGATAAAAGSDGANDYESSKTVKDNVVNKESTTRQNPAGDVKRQTVSVAVDRSAAEGISSDQISKLVESAAGFDADRGDVVTVQLVDFSTASAEQAQQALAEQKETTEREQFWSFVRTAAIAAAILLGLVIASILLLRRSRHQQRIPVDMPQLDETEEQPVLDAAPERPSIEQTAPAPIEPVQDESEAKRMAISNLAGADPARTAVLLRGLMDEGQ